MSKKIPVGISIVITLAAILITFQVTLIVLNNKYSKAIDDMGESIQMYQKLAQVDSIYRENYIGELDDEMVMDGIITGYILGTGDRYAYYMNKETFAEMKTDSSGEMVGIGVRVSFDTTAIKIEWVMANSPAAASGLEQGDRIIAVDGISVERIGYDEAVDRIRGNSDTYVNLTIERGDNEFVLNILRKKFEEETVISRHLETDPTIGVIRVLQFDDGTPKQFILACSRLLSEGVDKIIFDVRDNPGGNLTAICNVLDYLLPEGPIIHTEDAKGNRETISSDASELDVPMCVLVNGSTASAAELFAAALQDYDKAELIGTQTYGKGTAQNVISLPDGSGFAISDNAYYPPFSDRYEGVGVTPDHVVEMDEEVKNISLYHITDEQDTQLKYAVEIFNGKE